VSKSAASPMVRGEIGSNLTFVKSSVGKVCMTCYSKHAGCGVSRNIKTADQTRSSATAGKSVHLNGRNACASQTTEEVLMTTAVTCKSSSCQSSIGHWCTTTAGH